MRLTTAGIPLNISRPIVGRLTSTLTADRQESIWLGHPAEVGPQDLTGFKGVITVSPDVDLPPSWMDYAIPTIHSLRHHDHFHDGDVVVLYPESGFVRTLFRPESDHNVLFMTERCNSNCLMCSQPPQDHDDTQHFVDVNLELIRLIKPAPFRIGITGGEPTLLGEGLLRILGALRDVLPDTDVHMLTNGRLFAWHKFTQSVAGVRHPRLALGIPLYSDSALVHDHIVQAKHAFDQTVMGLHHLARWGVRVEIRVVLHRLSIPRLPHLAEYIYRNFPFVEHVALMALEPTGYTPRNRQELWLDPVEYQDQLQDAIEILSVRGLKVSIYNSQLCLLRPSLWKFARKSISDWKNIYLPECEACAKLPECGGLFKSADRLHSAHIKPFRDQNAINRDHVVRSNDSRAPLIPK
jgi:His-Xaa-Ser system radical SAM maturase HxsC